jgi:hypothetical protein
MIAWSRSPMARSASGIDDPHAKGAAAVAASPNLIDRHLGGDQRRSRGVTDEPPIPATTRRNLVSDGGGLPLPAVVTAANVNDTLLFAALLQDMPAVRTPSGRRRSRPGKVDADKAYDHAANRAYLRRRGITPRIARRGVESSTRLGRHRWRVERTLSWLSCYGVWRSLGSGLGAVVWVRAAGLCACLLQGSTANRTEMNV